MYLATSLTFHSYTKCNCFESERDLSCVYILFIFVITFIPETLPSWLSSFLVNRENNDKRYMCHGIIYRNTQLTLRRDKDRFFRVQIGTLSKCGLAYYL